MTVNSQQVPISDTGNIGGGIRLLPHSTAKRHVLEGELRLLCAWPKGRELTQTGMWDCKLNEADKTLAVESRLRVHCLGRLWICDGRELATVSRLQAFSKNPLIMALFEDWRKGVIRPELKEEIDRPEPDFPRLRQMLCEKRCPHWRDCDMNDWSHNPILDQLARYYDLWTVQDRYVRRTLLLLTILSNKGIWATGYKKEDLKKLAGVKKEKSVKRIIEVLHDLGFLKTIRRRTSRKVYKRYVFACQNRRAYERGYAEYWRRRIKATLSDCNATLERPVFRHGQDFDRTCYGVFVGPQPPEWFHEFVAGMEGIIESVMRDSWTDQLIHARRTAESYGGRSGVPKAHMAVRLARLDTEEMNRLRQRLHANLENILDKNLSLTMRKALDWVDFKDKVESLDANSTSYILRIDELDDFRKTKVDLDMPKKRSHREWSRRRRAPVY